MLLSLLPVVLIGLCTVLLGYFYWDVALDQVRALLESSAFVNQGWAWLDAMGLGRIKTFLAPLVVIFGVTPFIVLICLLGVAVAMTPGLIRLVVQRRFPQMEMRGSRSMLPGLLWALVSVFFGLLATVVSIPLWFVPPLILILPPLIWGWVTYRVMAYDALSGHATPQERRTLMVQHRPVLIAMGIVVGFLGSAPSFLWASMALFAVAFVLFLPLAVWIYTLVFAFSSLWFAHFCLAALQRLREAEAKPPVEVMDIELSIPSDLREPTPLPPTTPASGATL